MINVTQSSMPSYEEYCDEIKELWDTKWLTNMGAKHNQLQEELEAYLGVSHISLFSNGHLALENVLQAFDFPKGSEIITTPFTFASTTHAIVRCGYVPVFCDIKPDDYTIDESKIEALITPKTVAIIPVHVYGNVCNVDVIQSVADNNSLKVIYDAAHAFGVTYNGVGVTNFGDASMLSFHATKVYNTIEGGAVCFSDNSLIEKLNDLKNFGLHGKNDTLYVGGNAKMNEFQAAMGICNLRHIDDEINKRKLVYERYITNLSNIKGIKLNHIKNGTKSNYAYFPVVFDGYKYNRDEIFELLSDNGINSRKYFYPLTNDLMCYKDNKIFDVLKTPIARQIASKVLCLPMYSDLNLNDVDRICNYLLRGV